MGTGSKNRTQNENRIKALLERFIQNRCIWKHFMDPFVSN
jgi:hypothetical protein